MNLVICSQIIIINNGGGIAYTPGELNLLMYFYRGTHISRFDIKIKDAAAAVAFKFVDWMLQQGKLMF